ncbi:hypothetical protein YC2023_082273 [Brassica napus]
MKPTVENLHRFNYGITEVFPKIHPIMHDQNQLFLDPKSFDENPISIETKKFQESNNGSRIQILIAEIYRHNNSRFGVESKSHVRKRGSIMRRCNAPRWASQLTAMKELQRKVNTLRAFPSIRTH